MKETTNYNLKKIELTDSPPDITVHSGNFDIIDTELKERDTRVGPLGSLTTLIKTSIVNAINSLKTEVNEHKADYAKEATEFSIVSDATYTRNLSYYYKKNGWVTIQAEIIRVDGATIATGEDVILLPVGFRPKQSFLTTHACSASRNSGASAEVRVMYYASGQVRVLSTPAYKTLFLQVTFYAGGGTV